MSTCSKFYKVIWQSEICKNENYWNNHDTTFHVWLDVVWSTQSLGKNIKMKAPKAPKTLVES